MTRAPDHAEERPPEGTVERVFGLRELTRILALTPRRVAQLRRLDLLRGPSCTFREVAALRAAGAMLDAGASVRQIRGALASLRRQDPSLADPLTEVRFLVEGGRLLAQSDRVRFDPRTGQTVLDLDAEGLASATAAALRTGLVRPLAPPAEQAETWFERASSCDDDPLHWEDALEAYRRVVALDPGYAAAWNNLGLLLHRTGRYAEAAEAYATALHADPGCCQAAYNLGSLHEDESRGEDAIREYRHALELAPDYADAHFNLAAALARAGRAAEAAPHWKRYLALDADSPWARIARAHLEIVDP